MPVPVVEFSDERLPNGLRLIVAEDHLAPVVAVNLWYNVGSKHEVPGKTGFAHLFEHVMFQGSAHVGKAEHMALVQAAGGTLNGTTWLDRTNYFETLPSHQLELAHLARGGPDGTLLDALSQENLDNQREVVKNEKRWSYDNRPYGSWNEKILGHLFPEEHPYHHPTIGSMEDLDAASLDDVKAFFATYYAPNNAVLSVGGRLRPGEGPRAGPTSTSGRSRPTRTSRRCPTCRCRRSSAPRSARRSRTGCRCRACTSGSGRRRSATRASTRSTSPRSCSRAARAAGSTGGSCATSASPRTSPCSRSRSSAARRSCIGWATVRPGVDVATVEAAYLEELEKLASEAPSEDELARAKALIEADELGALARVEERADRLSMYATLFDDPGLINTPAAALPVGHRGADPGRGARRVPRRQPGRAHLRPAGRRRRQPRRRHDRDRAHRRAAGPGRAAPLRLPVHRPLRPAPTGSG